MNAGLQLGGFSQAFNSRPAGAQLEPRWAQQGVLFGSLDELILEHGDLLRPHLNRAVRVGYDKFSALHAACWSGGHLLYVPRGVAVDEPFHALAAMSDGGVDFGHTLVILEEGAEATFLYETASCRPQDGGLHCGATEILLGPGANLRYVQLQDWGHGVWHFAHQKALLERDAALQWTVAALGCRLSKVNQHVGLVGAGAQLPGERRDVHRRQAALGLPHPAASRSPALPQRFPLQGRLAGSIANGLARDDQGRSGALKTDGYQRNDNLLLSEHVRADSIPGLEIEADDVRCTHGSTSGKVDEELIFYAMCRGFTRKEATRMIVTGFFQQVFDRITIESVREALGRAIASRVREYE